jgi:acetyl-CoA acyltransferase
MRAEVHPLGLAHHAPDHRDLHRRPCGDPAGEFVDGGQQVGVGAAQAYEQAGVAPSDLDLVELHDCFATAELVHYDNLMLCRDGEAVGFLESGAPWRDGALPVNVSGGLQSKGRPIAATGLANIYEVATHLRGEAGPRQIEGARVGLAHVAGLGQSCGVHILERAA